MKWPSLEGSSSVLLADGRGGGPGLRRAGVVVLGQGALFRESLEALRTGWEVRRSLSDAEAESQAGRLRAQLTAIDPPAVNWADHWWALVLEQLDDGLL